MNKNILCIAVAGTFAFAAVSAKAEDMYRGAWYALPGLSYNWTDNDVKADDDVGAFLRIGKELSPNWDIQAGAAYTRPGEDSNLSTSGRYKQTLLGVDALYMFSRDRFRPFVLAGGGLARNKIDYSNAEWGDSKTSWMANVGAGFQYLVNDKFGLQADLRQVWSRAETGLVGNRDTETIGNTVLNFGAIFRFGAPAPLPVAAAEPAPAPAPAPAPVAPPEPAPAPAVVPEPAPAPAPAPVAEPCKPTVETITISAEQLFSFDKAGISEQGKQTLNETVDKLKQNDNIELVMVTGHTDRIGSDAYNQKLSERRANAVKNYLAAQGVNAGRMQAVGKGEAEPVVDCKGVQGRKKLIECLAPNRRVVIEATHKQEVGCTQ